MNAYIYQADFYCETCAIAIRNRLTREGRSPDDPNDETTFDSDQFPKGPIADGGGEADTPQHCSSCGAFLENPLTTDGQEYVKREVATIEARDRAVYSGNRHSMRVTRDWKRFYGYLFAE